MAYQHNQKDCAALSMPYNDWALWHLINFWFLDMPTMDKPWDPLTLAMQFATCMADHLWVILDREHQRVGVFCIFQFRKTWTCLLEQLPGDEDP